MSRVSRESGVEGERVRVWSEETKKSIWRVYVTGEWRVESEERERERE